MTEATQRELHLRLRDSFDQDLTANFVADASGGVMHANPAFLHLFGVELSPTEPLALRSLYTSQVDFDSAWGRLLEGFDLRHHVAQMQTAGGHPVHVVQNLVATRDVESRTVLHVCGYVYDRTVERELENELSKSRRLEAIGRLAGGVAHDFNNLLTVIVSAAHMLDELIDETRPDEHCLVSQLRGAADRAGALTSKLLDLGSRQPAAFSAVELTLLVDSAVPFLRSLLGEQHALEVVSQGESVVLGDGPQIEQALVNLIVNARDAMPQPGKVVIELGNVMLDEAFVEHNPWARVGRFGRMRVTDTGVGMSREVLDGVFEPFFTTKPSGTGLGLATCYGIAKRHQGFIHCESKPGAGARFDLHFPLTDGPHVSTSLPTHPRPLLGGNETLLVVDDDATVRAVVGNVLRRVGYRVFRAADGIEALEQLSDRPGVIDLIVLDIVMPRMNGPSTLRQVRARWPLLPILLCSGHAAEHFPNELLELPNVRFLAKPFGPSELLVAVRRLLDARRD